MKTNLSQCLVIGALAIGMTSTAMAGEYSKTKKLCNLSTLKGNYSFFDKTDISATAGEFRFDGKGHGVGNFTTKLPDIAQADEVLVGVVFTYFQDPLAQCKFTIPDFDTRTTIEIYSEVSGDAATSVGRSIDGRPTATALTRGPATKNSGK